MRLEGSFYQIERIEPTSTGYRIEVLLAAEHPIYAGHFPAQAVVPGVCTLTIIRECLTAATGTATSFGRIKECKFIAALLPCEGLRLVIVAELNSDGGLRCTAEREGQCVLKLKATLQSKVS